MLTKMLYSLVAHALLVCVASNALAQENSSVGIRADYTRSPSTPNHIVYRRFVETVVQLDNRPDSSGVHFIRDTFGIVHDHEGLARATNAFTVFQNANSAIKTEIREMEESVLCGEGRSRRTRDDTYAALDSVSDEREAIAQRIYRLSLQELDPVTKDALLSELAAMKLSLAGKKREHKSLYEESGSDVFSVIDNLCTAFRGDSNNIRHLTKRVDGILR